MTIRFRGAIPVLLLSTFMLGASMAQAQEEGGAAPTWIHRVDDFISREDLKDGVLPADREAGRVLFSHSAHAGAGVGCESCHHLGTNDAETPACATCHKGRQAIEVMHKACIDCHQGASTGPVACNECHTGAQGSLAGIFRFDLYDTVRGPLFIAAWALFALGVAWRIWRFTRLTHATRRASIQVAIPAAAPAAGPAAGPADVDRAFLERGMSRMGRIMRRLRSWERGTVFFTNPVMARVSVVFHVLLFLVPLLLPAHNILLFQSLRIALPSLPERAMDILTLVLLAFGGFFLLRRILVPRVRALTTLRDYLILALVAAPFVTAYMAYHQWLDYRTVLVTHMIIGEIVIAAIPFTKLGHMPFLVLSRFFVAGEYSWKPGNRRW